MLLKELLPYYLGGASHIVDLTPAAVDLERQLRPSAEVRLAKHNVDEAALLDLGPRTLVLGLLGPHAPAQSNPAVLAPILRRLEPGARVILFAGWPIAELPCHTLLEVLVDARCQVVEAVPLERVAFHGGMSCALIVDRVETPVSPRPYLAAARTSPGGDSDLVQDDRMVLRVANEYVLGDLVARPLRRRLIELEHAAVELAEAERERDTAYGSVVRLEAKLARSQSRLAALESSASFQVGRMLVNAARHPVRAVVRAPKDLVRVWRSRGGRQRPGAPANAAVPVQAKPAAPKPAKDRTVPLAFPWATQPPATLPWATLPSATLPPGKLQPAKLPPAGSELAVGPEDVRLLTMVAPSDLLVPRRLAESGLAGYESESLACFLAATDVAGPGAVLDVGANVGIYAALADALTGREVIAFEPTPRLVDVALRFAKDNDLNYVMESLALGARNGVATFYLSDSSDSSSSLAAGFRKSSQQIEVPVETLDSYLARTGVVPAVVKLDTEITEPDVLAGATRTITEHRPWILCEVLAGRVEARLTEVLAPFGYFWYPITDQIPFAEAERIVGDVTHHYLMWLLAPERPGDSFWASLRRWQAALRACTSDRATEMAVQRSAGVHARVTGSGLIR